MNKSTFKKMLPPGWTVTDFPRRVRHDDCTWYYREQLLIAIMKGRHTLSARSGGDIDISMEEEDGRRSYFRSSGDRHTGRLTQRLIDEGEFLLNNWIDIEYADDARRATLARKGTPFFDEYGITDEDVCYSITEACQALADAAARIDRDVHPFYDREWPVNFEAEP
jgi:hypothetical protein